MSTLWVLLGISALLTYFYWKQKWNALWAIVTGLSWIGVMVYILTYPPTNIVVGSFLHELLVLVFLGASMTIFFLWLRNRDSKFSDNGKSEYTEDEERERKVGLGNRSLMSMSETEYKAYLKSRRPVRR